MEILSVVPRGWCQGVVRAIRMAEKTAAEHPHEKITMLGMIVHNQYVVDACRKLGIGFVEDQGKTRLELLDEIDEGIVIFTAHGVSDDVYAKAEAKGLTIVDATCPDVARTHTLVREHCQKGGDVIYIGRPHHPEAEGTVSLSDHVHLIADQKDLNSLGGLHDVLITSQTTLSLLDTKQLIDACLKKYPDAQVQAEICNATRIRQEAVLNLKDTDLLIVVGDPRSNNSRMLAETGKKAGIPDNLLISSIEELKEDQIRGKNRIAVTSGSSTPNALTAQVIQVLKDYAETGIFPAVRVSSSVL
jgi:4-hydroxy-3-methylbut-2-enyl diphosphate reductase